jgi:hypothetical protein
MVCCFGGLGNGVEMEIFFENLDSGASYYQVFTASTLGYNPTGACNGALMIQCAAGNRIRGRCYIGGSATMLGGTSSAHSYFCGNLLG